ncbi:MAG: chorismate mutase [Bdellovibrionia bacterium]
MSLSNSDKNLEAIRQIELLRKKIDNLDTRLIAILKKRFQIVRKIGKLKKEMSIPVFQKSRWTQLIRDRIKLGIEADGQKTISSLFIRDLFTLIHSESLDLQQKHRKSKMQKRDIKVQT